MRRTLLDRDLARWEVYVVPGRGGFADSARLVFHPPPDTPGPPRAVLLEGGRAAAEGWLSSATAGELLDLLATSEPLT